MANNYSEWSEEYVLPAEQAKFLDMTLNYLNILAEADFGEASLAYRLPLRDEHIPELERTIQQIEDKGHRLSGPAAVAALLYLFRTEWLPDFVFKTYPGQKAASPPQEDTVEVVVYSEESSPREAWVALSQLMLRQFGEPAVFSLESAYTCSKPRPGEFGGAACVWDAWREEWMNTFTWTSSVRHRWYRSESELEQVRGWLVETQKENDRLREELRIYNQVLGAARRAYEELAPLF